ncbi:putative Mg2+ transporter-C (MgtC) family protein [Comamonas odontotermitis]|uniref:Protein MgtC n=1 Tax=Comamonas odontotermitis TaxID=379895 RepID=A0ABR6RJ39_9BURK|nr:MgtC/SapB family protein [Comamonas odontotermitis]MBB6579177.1 putative Mg2+ transporter-C (MgtC) family protein [Comamonas odontotermitis]
MNPSDSAVAIIWNTIAQELSDLPDLEQATRIVFKLVLAALLGGLLGFEREASGKAAGLRTHMLVAMGAAMFLAIAQLLGVSAQESSRVIQGVIAGVGFLGAGAILKSSKDGEEDIKGLTTAAGIWFTAAIGVAVGVGEESAAIFCTVIALVVLMVGPWLTKDRWSKK